MMLHVHMYDSPTLEYNITKWPHFRGVANISSDYKDGHIPHTEMSRL